MLALTFGSDAEARAAVARIRGIHDRVNGTLPEDAGALRAGAEYSAHDPALLAWVHLTLVDSVPRAYGRFVAPIGDDDVSRYAEESRWSAELIGARPEDLPPTAADVRSRLEQSLGSGALTITDTARTLARAVVNPPLRSMTGPLGRVHALAAVGDLPPAIRDAYGFRWTASDAGSLEAWSRRLQAYSRSAPAVVRRWGPARRAARRFGDAQQDR